MITMTEKATKCEHFLNSLTGSIKTYKYYVDWEKIESLQRERELHLHMLNYLIGKEDIKKELKFLIKKEPSIIQTLPILLATRDCQLNIFDEHESDKKEQRTFMFTSLTLQSEKDIDNIIFFLEKTGIVELIEKQKIRNFNDYVFGLEVGLDTHARKNRGGTLMENLVEEYIKEMKDIIYISQASYKKIKDAFGITLHDSLKRRIFDFVICKNGKFTFIESNFFNEGGTKLKSVAGEFKQLQQDFRNYHPEHRLVWVTDGNGWTKTKQPLLEAFQTMENILNISMLEEKKLDAIV